MLRQYVLKHLRLSWSPQQISGKLKAMNGGAANGVGADFDAGDPALPVVSHETIYVIPRGDLRKDLIGFLRQAHKTRGARGRGTNRQGRLVDMVSIHERPHDVVDRLIPGDWEGDFVKGAGNASAIGTLVERKSRYTLIARMKDRGAQAALDGFTKASAKVPKMMRRSLAYDQGKEMARHKELTSRLACRSTSAIRTAPGKGCPTKTSTASSGSTCPRASTCRSTASAISTGSPTASTPDCAPSSASKHPRKS
jgi:IS30 family transposase